MKKVLGHYTDSSLKDCMRPEVRMSKVVTRRTKLYLLVTTRVCGG